MSMFAVLLHRCTAGTAVLLYHGTACRCTAMALLLPFCCILVLLFFTWLTWWGLIVRLLLQHASGRIHSAPPQLALFLELRGFDLLPIVLAKLWKSVAAFADKSAI